MRRALRCYSHAQQRRRAFKRPSRSARTGGPTERRSPAPPIGGFHVGGEWRAVVIRAPRPLPRPRRRRQGALFRPPASRKFIKLEARAQERSMLAEPGHHHNFCVELNCQEHAQVITVEVILCKYSRRSRSGGLARSLFETCQKIDAQLCSMREAAGAGRGGADKRSTPCAVALRLRAQAPVLRRGLGR